MSDIPEPRFFDAVIMPADLVRRWAETMEARNRILEAEGATLFFSADILEGIEATLDASDKKLIQERTREDERLKENIIQFPDLKKVKRRNGQKLNTQSA